MTIHIKTILIIDDDENILDIYTLKFKNAGYQVQLASTGADGLKVAFEIHPDIILLDVQMHDMRGTEVLTKLRQDSWGNTVPVIMLTNMQADTKEVIRCIATEQPSYYLIKADWSPSEVLDKVAEVLQSVVE